MRRSLQKELRKVSSGRHATLTGLRTSAQASGNVLQSLDVPSSLAQLSFRDFGELMHSTFQGQDELRPEENRTLTNSIINGRERQRDRSDRSYGRARYAPTRELGVEYLEKDWNQVWAARAPAAMEIWLCWLAVALNLSENEVSPSSRLRTGGRLLLAMHDAKAQTKHHDFAVRDGESPRFFIIATVEMRADLYGTAVSSFYLRHSGAQGKL